MNDINKLNISGTLSYCEEDDNFHLTYYCPNFNKKNTIIVEPISESLNKTINEELISGKNEVEIFGYLDFNLIVIEKIKFSKKLKLHR